MDGKQLAALREKLVELDDNLFESNGHEDSRRRARDFTVIIELIDEEIHDAMFVDKEGFDLRAVLVGERHLFELTIEKGANQPGRQSNRPMGLRRVPFFAVDEIKTTIDPAMSALSLTCSAKGSPLVSRSTDRPEQRAELLSLAKAIEGRT